MDPPPWLFLLFGNIFGVVAFWPVLDSTFADSANDDSDIDSQPFTSVDEESVSDHARTLPGSVKVVDHRFRQFRAARMYDS